MGSRANYVTVTDAAHELCYSHWARSRRTATSSGARCTRWRSTAVTIGRSRREGWLDDRWAEGVALVDPARRVLLFHGGEEVHASVPLAVACALSEPERRDAVSTPERPTPGRSRGR